MKALTILGARDEDSLGFTLVHEHLLTNPPKVFSGEDREIIMESVDNAVKELEIFASAGGKTIVEGTPINYGRNVEGMVEIAKRAPHVNIIAVTGFYTAKSFDENLLKLNIKELAEIMIRDIREGMDGTRYRAGAIKVAASYFTIFPAEERCLRAAARASVETGAPVQVHTTYGTMGLEILSILKKEGANLKKVLLLHMDENMDLWLLRKILEREANVSFDKFARVKYRVTEEQRIKCIEKLVEEGFSGQIMMSTDMGRKTYFKSYGGGPGLDYLPRIIVPRLREMGWDEELITQIFVNNPRDYLKFLP